MRDLNHDDDQNISFNLKANQDRRYTCSEAAQCITIRCQIGQPGQPFEPKTTYSLQLHSRIVKNTLNDFRNHSVYLTEFQFIVDLDGYDYLVNASDKTYIAR